MKTIINKLITLADNLDNLNLKKSADLLDRIIVTAVRGEDFEDLMKLFDEPTTFEDKDEDIPGKTVTELPEEDVLPTIEEESTSDTTDNKKEPSRLELLMRRNKVLKLKKMLEKAEAEEAEEEKELKVTNENTEPVIEESEVSFEDEDDENEDEENEADDDSEKGIIEKVISHLKSNPELLEKFLLLVI